MDDPSEVPDLLPCLIRPKVALAEMAVLGVIFAILRWQPQPTFAVVVLIVLIVLIGLAAVVALVKDEFNLRRAKRLLAFRLEEGQALLDRTSLRGDSQVTEQDLRKWNDLTEQNLRKYVDELHVGRFRFAGFNDTPGSFTTIRLRAKLIFLDNLLEQLKG